MPYNTVNPHLNLAVDLDAEGNGEALLKLLQGHAEREAMSFELAVLDVLQRYFAQEDDARLEREAAADKADAASL